MTASTLELALTYEHARIRELAEPVHHPAQHPAQDPVRHPAPHQVAAQPEHRHQTDWFYAIAAQHLAAAEDVLLPQILRRLPDGGELVTRYVGNAKRLERSLRFLKGHQYGDGRVLHLRHDDLWRHLDRLMAEHEQLETECSRRLCDELADDDVNALTEKLLEAEEIAPTRAHPYSPHTGTAGRLVHRIWRMADNAWDSAEGRVVPIRYHVHPKRNSALSHYLYGTAMPHDEHKPS